MKEIRTSEIRATGQKEDSFIIEGMPIVFNSPTKIGSFNEVICSGALNDADMSDIKLLYNHDTNKIPLARTPKTMNFTVDQRGLNIVAELPKTAEGNSIYTAIKRGDLSGMSFAFSVPDGGDEFDINTKTRTINKIEKVHEVSITPFPAYEQTSIEARNKNQDKTNELKIKINQILKRSL